VRSCHVQVQLNWFIQLPNTGQPGGSNVTFYIQATDKVGSAISPQYSHTVKWLFPTDINGDGIVDVADVARVVKDFGRFNP
jgi:hypothetical protein